MRRYLVWPGVAGFYLTGRLVAQTAPVAPPIPLLERFIGQWTMTGTVRKRPATYRLEGGWVLQRRFVELHMEDVEHTPPRYEARVFIGPDTVPGRLVGHWLDNFGAAFSVPPATGAAVGDSLTLDFPYRDGAFHDTFCVRSRDRYLDDSVGCGGWGRSMEALRGLPGGPAGTPRVSRGGHRVADILQDFVIAAAPDRADWRSEVESCAPA
jgi:hypothetical protein